MKFKCNVLVAMAAVLPAILYSNISANAVTLNLQSGTSLFDGASHSVRITSPYLAGGVETRVTAGGFRVTDGSSDFIAWCLDVEHSLILGTEYQITSNPYSNIGAQSLDQIRKNNIEMLFEASLPYPSGVNPVDVNNGDESAAFQLALWELRYEAEGNAFDLSDGEFSAKAGRNNGIIALAESLIANMGTSITDYDTIYYESLESSQHLVTVEPGPPGGNTPVPIPAALPLFLSGLGGFGFFSWRRKRITG